VKRMLNGKLLLLCIAMLMLLFVVACGGNGDTEDVENDDGEGTEDTDDGGEAAGDGEISGDLEIQYFVGGYGDSWWKEVINDFQEAYPDVNIIEHAGPNINDEMRARWVANDPPDVVYIDGAGSSETQMVEDGQLMNLDEFVQGIELENGDALLDSFIVEPATYDGEIYSLPLVFDTWGTWYDRALFEAEGYEVPTDFESFMSSMEEIKEAEGIDPFVTSGQHPYYFLRGMLNPAFGAAGGDELLADVTTGAEGAWTSEPVVKIMENVERMAQERLFDS